MVKVKICGITTLEDAQVAVEYGADLLGFNFYVKSSRFVEPRKAASIAKAIPRGVLKVGVFVNATPENVSEIANNVGLDVIQLHGDEDDDHIRVVSLMTEKPVIKAFRVVAGASLESISHSEVDAVLLDSVANGKFGGTGKTFDWNLIGDILRNKQVFLAGGLTPGNVCEAIRIVRPYAVDVAGGVESSPGKKEPAKIKAFIENARSV